MVKKHERTANLFNASGGSIVVSGVVDLEVHFGDVFLRLEEVLVAEVGFNVISPWTASERGWKTFLAKGGSRLYKGNKKSIKLMGAQRAWWAVSGSKKNPNASRKARFLWRLIRFLKDRSPAVVPGLPCQDLP